MEKFIPKKAAPSAAASISLKTAQLTGILLVIATSAMAQQTASQLNTFKSTFFTIINVIFLIGVGYGLVKTVLGFFGQHKEGAMMNLMYLVIGIIVWACFNYFFADFGGATKISI